MKNFKEYIADKNVNEGKLDSINMAIEQLAECLKDAKKFDPTKFDLTYYSERNLYALCYKSKSNGAIDIISGNQYMTLKEFQCYLRGAVDMFFVKSPAKYLE